MVFNLHVFVKDNHVKFRFWLSVVSNVPAAKTIQVIQSLFSISFKSDCFSLVRWAITIQLHYYYILIVQERYYYTLLTVTDICLQKGMNKRLTLNEQNDCHGYEYHIESYWSVPTDENKNAISLSKYIT